MSWRSGKGREPLSYKNKAEMSSGRGGWRLRRRAASLSVGQQRIDQGVTEHCYANRRVREQCQASVRRRGRFASLARCPAVACVNAGRSKAKPGPPDRVPLRRAAALQGFRGRLGGGGRRAFAASCAPMALVIAASLSSMVNKFWLMSFECLVVPKISYIYAGKLLHSKKKFSSGCRKYAAESNGSRIVRTSFAA